MPELLEENPLLEFSISDVAHETGLSAHTLRYYERARLIDGVGRAQSGHRRYCRADVDWILFLSKLRSTGMPIRVMQRYARLRYEGESTNAARRELLEAHRAALCKQLRELEGHVELIDWKIENYRQLERFRLEEEREESAEKL